MLLGCCAPVEFSGDVARFGFDFIELPGKQLHAQTAEEFLGTERTLSAAGLRCLALNAYCPPEIVIAGAGFRLENATAYARSLARRASALGVENIGIGSPASRNLPEGYDRALAWSQAVDFVKTTAEEFAKLGITVCVEAVGRCYCNFINTLDEAIALANAVKLENCKIVADFYNMEHVGEADIDLAGYLPMIGHAHISDDDESPQRRYFLKPQKAALHKLRLGYLYRLGYDHKISLEIDVPPDECLCAESLDIMRA